MFKRFGILAAVVGIAGLAYAAFATPATHAADPTPDVVLQGAGTLSARGTGVAAVKGLMDYRGNGAIGDILLVKDVAGDATVEVNGYNGTGQFQGFTVYFDFRGTVTAKGTDVAVIIVGHDIELRAAGRGWAFLKGRGEYRVNGGPPRPWTDAGVFAGVAAPEATPAP